MGEDQQAAYVQGQQAPDLGVRSYIEKVVLGLTNPERLLVLSLSATNRVRAGFPFPWSRALGDAGLVGIFSRVEDYVLFSFVVFRRMPNM